LLDNRIAQKPALLKQFAPGPDLLNLLHREHSQLTQFSSLYSSQTPFILALRDTHNVWISIHHAEAEFIDFDHIQRSSSLQSASMQPYPDAAMGPSTNDKLTRARVEPRHTATHLHYFGKSAMDADKKRTSPCKFRSIPIILLEIDVVCRKSLSFGETSPTHKSDTAT